MSGKTFERIAARPRTGSISRSDFGLKKSSVMSYRSRKSQSLSKMKRWLWKMLNTPGALFAASSSAGLPVALTSR